MLHLRNRETVLYSLVYIPESGPEGTWVEVRDGRVFCGPDDPTRPAVDVLRAMTAVDRADFARFKENLRERFSDSTTPTGSATSRPRAWKDARRMRWTAAFTTCDRGACSAAR